MTTTDATSNQVPSDLDFATEVKTDRLKILYQSTLLICGVVVLFVLTFGISRAVSSETSLALIGAALSLIGASLITRFLLSRNQLIPATWVYALGGVVAIGVVLAAGNEITVQIVPFVAPIIVFVVGLLISPSSTITITLISTVVIIVVPSLKAAQLVLGVHQLFAILLMFLSAALSAQVSGELYQVTQWALLNYQRERKTNDELFDKRRELQMSLKRSEVLSDNLRETNKELESAKSSAEEAKNFRGQFLANMSHELRTPLNAIIGFSETMLQFPIMYDNEVLPASYERDLSQIYASGRQLLHVINDILDLAKVDAGKLEVHLTAVDSVPLMNAAMSTTKGLVGKKSIQLDKDVPENLPKVFADETRLRQVLLNIYSNAAKYTDRGSIKLTARVVGNDVEVAIKDTGIGIDPEYHDKLFQEFQQAKAGGRDARSGSGLGLAISRQLLELMGGRIWMNSQVGEGSTFYFTVPIYRNQDGKTPAIATQAVMEG
jgi:signal transduction histidine kinase